jgi:hypothetical protein
VLRLKKQLIIDDIIRNSVFCVRYVLKHEKELSIEDIIKDTTIWQHYDGYDCRILTKLQFYLAPPDGSTIPPGLGWS